MGGGESNSSPPVDVAPGGGTYPVDAFGTAYNPAWSNSGGWSGVGQGMQQFGASMQNQPVPNFMTGSQNVAQSNIPGASQQSNLVPLSSGGDGTVEAMMRLLEGLAGGGQSSKLRQLWNWQPRQLPTELLQPDFTPYQDLV